MTKQRHERPLVVYVSAVANLVIMLSKFAAAFFTGSSAMLSEAIHSTVDVTNELLLLLGIHRSKRPADENHPFGHGKALYFWSLIVSIAIFGIGGGMAFYEGITHLEQPHEIQDPTWNYAVLGVAFVAEMISLLVTIRQFLATKKPGESAWQALERSKDPTLFIPLGENSADVVGIVIAFLGILFSKHFGDPRIDGIASVLIGVILTAVALFLVHESGGLLVGESADKEIVRQVCALVKTDPAVQEVHNPLTMQLGPHDILLAMNVQFQPKLPDLPQVVMRLESKIREAYPDIRKIFIEAESIEKQAH